MELFLNAGDIGNPRLYNLENGIKPNNTSNNESIMLVLRNCSMLLSCKNIEKVLVKK